MRRVLKGKGVVSMTTHMDAYTILYQAKEQLIDNDHVRQMVEEKIGGNAESFLAQMDENSMRDLAVAGLEAGIKQIRYEYPPSVSKRMQKYYYQNKETLLEAFSHNVKACVTKWDEEAVEV